MATIGIELIKDLTGLALDLFRYSAQYGRPRAGQS